MNTESSNTSDNDVPVSRKVKSHAKKGTLGNVFSQEEKAKGRSNKYEQKYLVEDILKKEKRDGTWKYLVKWKGFPKEEATWEPSKNLENAKIMLKNFELKQKLKSNKEGKSVKRFKDTSFEAEKQKAHKKIDNSSFFSNLEMRNSEGDFSLLGNSQFTFKNSSMISVENDREGDFRLGDKPKKILFAKKTKCGILFAVEWEVRKDETIPEISFYDNLQMKTYAPQVLIDFYEAHLRMKEENEQN